MSVEEYIGEFEQLKIRSRIEEEPKQAIIRFLKGLDQSIAEKVNLQPYRSFEDACKLAIKVERYSKNKNPYTSSCSRPNPPPTQNSPLKPYFAPQLETQAKIDPSKHKGNGVVMEFPKLLDGKRSFKCQGYGHFQA